MDRILWKFIEIQVLTKKVVKNSLYTLNDLLEKFIIEAILILINFTHYFKDNLIQIMNWLALLWDLLQLDYRFNNDKLFFYLPIKIFVKKH